MTMKVSAGIDPGINGAVVIVAAIDNAAPTCIAAIDIPTTGRGRRNA